MDKVLCELDDIQETLSRSIGVLLVLADGLDGYTQSMRFSDDHTEAFVNAMFLAYDALDAIIGEFGEVLDRVRGEGKDAPVSTGSTGPAPAKPEEQAIR